MPCGTDLQGLLLFPPCINAVLQLISEQPASPQLPKNLNVADDETTGPGDALVAGKYRDVTIAAVDVEVT